MTDTHTIPARLRHLTRTTRLTLVGLLVAALAAVGFIASPALAAPATTGIFSDSLTPKIAADSDRVAVELGIRFTPQSNGTVTALQYYQGAKATGVTSATLWSARGTVLATASFDATTKTGWRTVTLDKPVALTAGSTYVASYNAPKGGYPVTERDLTAAKTLNGFSLKSGAGVYRYGKTGKVPTSTWQGSNYLVDVVFTPSTNTAAKPQPTATSKPTPTATPKPTATPTATPKPTATATPTPTATPKPTATPTATPTPSTPSSSGCVGAANTPGGADPWGGCWPGPQNTGYPQGLPGDTRTPVTLTTYTGPTTIRSCGVVIDSKVVNGTIIIEAGNGTTSKATPCVTIRNSLVKGVIFSEKSTYGPVLIEDTEVAPTDLPWWENIGRSNFFAYRVNSHGGEGVIKCDTNCEAKDNWVHGMELGGSYHYNAFGGNGTNNFRIEHNYASCGDWSKVSNPTSDAGCSAVIGFYGDYAPIQNITITRNFLASSFDTSSSGQHTQAGYCLNPGYYPGKPYPDTKNLTVTENIFARGGSGKCGVYGPTNSLNKRGASNGNVWENNRYSDGTVITRVEE
ncbi:DUF4082 domain-containing protein [Microbacterium sp.]|uniref:DUF4082 domain-containing protein n=1 Tax=Microbacterium sp. TaxID=51671 RepID=UPI00289B140C|nr:DUF4082 domain-containing protein [Microbacterium sp.]